MWPRQMRFHRGHLVSAKTLASCGRCSSRSDGHVAPSGTDGRVGNDELGQRLELSDLLLHTAYRRSLRGIESGLLEIDGVLALLQRVNLRLEFFIRLYGRRQPRTSDSPPRCLFCSS